MTSLMQVLQRKRQAAGLSLEEAAAQAGISAFSLTQYEQGLRVPRDEVRLQLARLYQTAKMDFYGES